jgi:tetratricopeptide (TPR) repeat protein
MRHSLQLCSLAGGCGLLAGLALSPASSVAQQPAHEHATPAVAAPAISLLNEIGRLHHPVSTRIVEAQRYFDQGLSLVYAFHYRDARRSFQEAARLDSTLAIAHWGIALTLGSFINHQIAARDVPAASAAIQRALALAAPAHERALIEALAVRYRESPAPDIAQLERDYRSAMALVAARYPDDLDVQTLYAESIMNLRPWRLWNSDGTPADGTAEMVRILEQVLQRDPTHIGANHYYIHALEASRSPERALPSAIYLNQQGFSRSAVHLIHMPAHVWYRTGDYALSAGSAARADSVAGHFAHNLQFLFVARSMLDDSAATLRAAEWLAEQGTVLMKRTPTGEIFLGMPLLARARYGRWTELLAIAAPDSSQHYHNLLWHWTRGLALAGVGRTREAESALDAYRTLVAAYPGLDGESSFNSPRAEFRVAERMLAASVALAANRRPQAIQALRDAVVAEDALLFSEPPDWIFPAREALGAALLASGDFTGAERVFRDDLERNRRSPRSLRGLAESLRRQGRAYEADLVSASVHQSTAVQP